MPVNSGRRSLIYFNKRAVEGGKSAKGRQMLKRFLKDKAGATAIEYGLIVAVISLAIVAGVTNMTNSAGFLFANNASKFTQTLNGN